MELKKGAEVWIVTVVECKEQAWVMKSRSGYNSTKYTIKLGKYKAESRTVGSVVRQNGPSKITLTTPVTNKKTGMDYFKSNRYSTDSVYATKELAQKEITSILATELKSLKAGKKPRIAECKHNIAKKKKELVKLEKALKELTKKGV